MPRPKTTRRIRFSPDVRYFKPRGVPMRHLKEVVLDRDELEAIKLHDVDELSHIEAAEQMQISQPTFGRILDSAYKKVAHAIVSGKALRIEEKRRDI